MVNIFIVEITKPDSNSLNDNSLPYPDLLSEKWPIKYSVGL
jgi:uncharacterized protein Veg